MFFLGIVAKFSGRKKASVKVKCSAEKKKMLIERLRSLRHLCQFVVTGGQVDEVSVRETGTSL